MMIRSTGRRRLLTAVSLVTGVTLLAAGCGSSDSNEGDSTETSASAEGTSTDRELVVWAGAQTPIPENFNPFAPEVQHLATGGIYETLFYYNKASSGEPTPLLGESFEFNEDGTQLTIKLREGVKWSDGEAFTADDVVYSLTDENSAPTYITGAEATDDLTVVVSFDGPQFTNEFSILGSTWMRPEHVWADLTEDPMTWGNTEPVGTGPYLLDTFSDAAYTAKANPDYWGGEPNVKSVRYIGLDANQSAEDLLRTGQLDWAGMFVPDPDSLVSASNLGYINTPQDPTVLYTCSNADLGCEGDQTDVAVRQALNLALDRGSINEKAFVGLAGEISPTFALLGRDDDWISPDVEAESPQAADVDAAGKILEDAGYEKDADGMYAKDGEPIDLTLTSVDGWTDYNNAAKLIQEQTAAAGIKVTASTISWNEFAAARDTGDFEMIMGGVVGTSVPDPFQIYRDWFSGPATSEVGESIPAGYWGFARYSNPVVDDAVTEAASTNDVDAKKAAYATIQEEITRDLPYIPLVINASQTFYNQTDYTGWPTEDNLYAFPPAWGAGASGVVLHHLGGTE